jgi:hypothetical protein
VCASLILYTSAGTAQSHNHANNCRAIESFAYVVSVSAILKNPARNHDVINIEKFGARNSRIDRIELYTLLRDTGFNNDLPQVSLFLSDVSKYVKHRAKPDQLTAMALLGSSRFTRNLSDMITIINTICTAGIIDAATGEDLTNREPSTASLTPVATIMDAMAKVTRNIGSEPERFSLSPEMKRLSRVFLICLGLVSTLVLADFAYRLSLAMRLDRYNCQIPATATIGAYQTTGIINIASRFGLSFVVDTPSDPIHAQHFALEAEVSFTVGDHNINAIQSIAFDGSAGFKILTKLSKQDLRDILSHSKSFPIRRLERRRKNKPAPTVRASPA